MGIRFKATHVVLAMLCAMYFITYVDRVNIGTAASEIQKELGLSNTQLGLVFSAFAYPYLLFQVIGGWVGDRFGPRKTLFWCGMIWAAATISTSSTALPHCSSRASRSASARARPSRRQRARCNTGRPRTAAVLRRD
ncbi:MFS family permease [Bradyrhizobium japonicum]